MRTELIQIPTDGIPMDGALHLPEGPVRGSVLYFHGNTIKCTLIGVKQNILKLEPIAKHTQKPPCRKTVDSARGALHAALHLTLRWDCT